MKLTCRSVEVVHVTMIDGKIVRSSYTQQRQVLRSIGASRLIIRLCIHTVAIELSRVDNPGIIMKCVLKDNSFDTLNGWRFDHRRTKILNAL